MKSFRLAAHMGDGQPWAMAHSDPVVQHVVGRMTEQAAIKKRRYGPQPKAVTLPVFSFTGRPIEDDDESGSH